MFSQRFSAVAATAVRSSVRQMSHARGTPAEMRADTMRWRNISIGKRISFSDSRTSRQYLFLNNLVPVDFFLIFLAMLIKNGNAVRRLR